MKRVDLYPLGKWFELNDEILDLLEDGDEVVILLPDYSPTKAFACYDKRNRLFYINIDEISETKIYQPQEVESICIIEKSA